MSKRRIYPIGQIQRFWHVPNLGGTKSSLTIGGPQAQQVVSGQHSFKAAASSTKRGFATHRRPSGIHFGGLILQSTSLPLTKKSASQPSQKSGTQSAFGKAGHSITSQGLAKQFTFTQSRQASWHSTFVLKLFLFPPQPP